MYIDKIGKNDLAEFVGICHRIGLEFDKEKFTGIVSNTLKYLDGDESKRSSLRYMQELENRWYKSLSTGKPDYSVYDDVYYLADTWVCWKKYSRQYVVRMIKHIDFGRVNSVADLGCGIGYATRALQETYKCVTYGTNLEDTKQYKICEEVFKGNNNCILRSGLDDIGPVDMVFASEYFEHFDRPVEHLIDVLKNLKPKHVLFANTFNAKSIGHFDTYYHFGKGYTGREISRLFTKTLKNYGYEKVVTKCWNNRPNYYKKLEDAENT